MVTSILLKLLTLKWDISRTIWLIVVGDGSFFFSFFTLFHMSVTFFRPELRFPLSLLLLDLCLTELDCLIEYDLKPGQTIQTFTQQQTTFVYHLLHVVACCFLGQWSNGSNIVQLYIFFLWIFRLKCNCSPRNH